MHVPARGGLPAMMDSVCLPKPGCFPFFRGIEGADRDAAFQGIYWLGQAFPFQLQGIFIFFEIAVYGCGAYLREFFSDVIGDAESRPLGYICHLLPHEWG